MKTQAEQPETIQTLIDQIIEGMQQVSPQTLKDRMGLDSDPDSLDLFIEARQVLEEDNEELQWWAEYFHLATVTDAKHTDLIQVATIILARWDMENPDNIKPAIGYKEDLRSALARATK